MDAGRRLMMVLVRILLIVGWLALAWATMRAAGMGLDLAGDFFFGDMSHPWRGQFNIDFLAHLLLMAFWMWWTEKNRLFAPLVGLLAIVGGAFFSFAYLLFRSFGGDKSLSHFLLGRHHKTGEILCRISTLLAHHRTHRPCQHMFHRNWCWIRALLMGR